MTIKPNVGGCMHCGHDHFNRTCLTCHDTDGPCRAMLQWEVKVLGTSLTQKVEMLSAHVEPPEPQPDLDVTIKSLRDTIEGLRNQLDDARQTERDLDAEVAALQKENTRLTKLAWEAHSRPVEPPVPAPHPDPASLERENDRLNEKLRAFTQTSWEAQAQVDSLLKQVKYLEAENKNLLAQNEQLDRENRRLASMAWETQKKIESLEADNKALRASSSELKALYDERLERYKDLADGMSDLLEKLGFGFGPGKNICGND